MLFSIISYFVLFLLGEFKFIGYILMIEICKNLFVDYMVVKLYFF